MSEARLVDLFLALAAIPSPSGSEGACADAVTAELTMLGLDAVRDDSGARLGSNGGNLYCRVPASAAGVPLFFCAHLDTVPPCSPPRPVLVDGILRNATPSIVGADNKAAIVVLLEAVRAILEERRPHAGVELIFTIGEEQGLRSVRAFDCSRLQAQSGFVLDHPEAIGGLVAAAPSRFIVRVTMRGRAAHAGIAPEEGINAVVALAKAIAALPDPEADVTVNVGRMNGGSAVNVVPDLAQAEIEVRSLDHASAEKVVQGLKRTLEDWASRTGCTLELEIETAYRGYRVPDDSPALRLASSALARVGRPASPLQTGGGSDANFLRARGFDCLNLAHAVVDFHGPDEHVAVADLVLMTRVVLEIVSAACSSQPSPPSREGKLEAQGISS